MARTKPIDSQTEERRKFLANRRGVLDRDYPIQRNYDDGATVARWKLALRKGLPVASHILDQLQADGWEIWDCVEIVRSTYGTGILSSDSYSSLSLGIDRKETVTVTVNGWPIGLNQSNQNEFTLVRNEFGLFHGYLTHGPDAVARLAFSVPPLHAQLLLKRAA